MKYFLALAVTTMLIIMEHQYFNNQNQSDFERWTTKYNKFFSDSEKIYRMEVYYSNKKMIEEHNQRKDTSYQMGENQFMTLTNQEFIALLLQESAEYTKDKENIEYPKDKENVEYPKDKENVEYPKDKENVNTPIIQQQKLSAVDWRNYVKVKDEGHWRGFHGWALAAANSMEAYFAIKKSKWIEFSAQQLLDCCVNCDRPKQGLAYIQKNGVTDNDEYPLSGYSPKPCQKDYGYWRIYNYAIYDLLSLDENQLQQLLNSHPVTVNVEGSNFQFYKSGIFNCNGDRGGYHYVLAVGYDSNNNWIIQNSWGEDWGEKGHMRLAPGNTCDILWEATQIIN